MKQEFEMTQQNMDDIIAINKNNSNVVMKIGSYTTSNSLAESINRYWEKLGDEMGFKHMTVEGSSKGKLFFLAEPKPIEIPKTQTELEIDKYISESEGYLNHHVSSSLRKIVAQLEMCNYECEAGILGNNLAFLALKKLSNI